jgi:hypothetical protein
MQRQASLPLGRAQPRRAQQVLQGGPAQRLPNPRATSTCLLHLRLAPPTTPTLLLLLLAARLQAVARASRRRKQRAPGMTVAHTPGPHGFRCVWCQAGE